jgi:arabinofuranosyltransferase
MEEGSEARVWRDAAALLLLIAALLLPGLAALRSPAHPAEDAAMLMRYVQHIADGHGIVWNVGERPADGATDFLFTLLAAGLVRLGVPLEPAVRSLSFTAHVLTVLLVYGAARRLHGAPVPAAFLSALFLAWGPGFRYVEMYFGTPLFTLCAALAWLLAYRLREAPESLSRSLAFALASLAAGLARPEGVFLTLFMLAAVVFWAGPRRAARAVAVFVAVFAVLGGTYFLWRWRIFDHPLPTPFYKKGGGTLHWEGLRDSAEGVARLCLPVLLLAPLALRSRDAFRRLLFSAFPIGGFAVLWILLSSEMNILHRFQFALVPVALIAWPDWLAGLRRDLQIPRISPAGRRVAVLFLGGIAGSLLLLQLAFNRPRPGLRDGRYEVARRLAGLAPRGYTLVTTEAGLLPLYSGWRSVDAWGLNDIEIARAGLSEARLERERPALIVFHAGFSPLVPAAPGDDSWSRTLRTLQDYAARRGYLLAAAFGHDPFETHYYLVRPDCPDAPRIVEAVRGADYRWYAEGQPSVNFALWRPVAAPASGAEPLPAPPRLGPGQVPGAAAARRDGADADRRLAGPAGGLLHEAR